MSDKLEAPFNKLPAHIDKVGGLSLPVGVFLCWECGSYYDTKYKCSYCREGKNPPMRIYDYDDPEENIFNVEGQINFEYDDYVFELPMKLPKRTKELFVKRFTKALDTMPAEAVEKMFEWFPNHYNPIFDNYFTKGDKRNGVKTILEDIKARSTEFTFNKVSGKAKRSAKATRR